MQTTCSMFTVKALGILDGSDGSRIIGQFYRPAQKDGLFSSISKQAALEKSVSAAAASISPGTTDILLIDSSTCILFQRIPSAECLIAFVCFVSDESENELLFSALLNTLVDGLKVIISQVPMQPDSPISKQSIIDNYDAIAILFDEIVDDGVILELDTTSLFARLPRRLPPNRPAAPSTTQFTQFPISR